MLFALDKLREACLTLTTIVDVFTHTMPDVRATRIKAFSNCSKEKQLRLSQLASLFLTFCDQVGACSLKRV